MFDQRSETIADQNIVRLTHVYAALRQLVWDCFTTPEHLVHWWGPNGFHIEPQTADFRLGGHWDFVMVGPDGTRWQNHQVFTEYDPINAYAYQNGTPESALDETFSVRLTFVDLGDKTEVTLTHTFPTPTAFAQALDFGAREYGLQTLANAQNYLSEKGLI